MLQSVQPLRQRLWPHIPSCRSPFARTRGYHQCRIDMEDHDQIRTMHHSPYRELTSVLRRRRWAPVDEVATADFQDSGSVNLQRGKHGSAHTHTQMLHATIVGVSCLLCSSALPGVWSFLRVTRNHPAIATPPRVSIVLGAWSVRCVGWAGWVGCRCFLPFVFLGGAGRLELSPCKTPLAPRVRCRVR